MFDAKTISPLLCLLTALPVAALASTAQAAEEKCAVEGQVVSYVAPKKLPSGFDTRCDNAHGKCKKLDLKAWLYVPDGAGPHPVIIYNHGSNRGVRKYCEFVDFFTARGYVVMMPQRRGHGESTGLYLDEYIDHHCVNPPKHGNEKGFCKMQYLHEQVADVKAAIHYVKKVPGVDAERIAIMGHSFGGIVTTFANQKKLGQKVAISFAGASQSWEGNDYAKHDMLDAVRHGVTPLYLFEPLNDVSIEPTIALAKAAGESCRQYQSALFPAVDIDGDHAITRTDYSGKKDPATDKTNRDLAHGMSTKMVREWGPSVHEFMHRYFERPAGAFDDLCLGSSLVE